MHHHPKGMRRDTFHALIGRAERNERKWFSTGYEPHLKEFANFKRELRRRLERRGVVIPAR